MYIPCLHIVVIVAVVVVVVLAVVGIVAKLFLDMVLFCDYWRFLLFFFFSSGILPTFKRILYEPPIGFSLCCNIWRSRSPCSWVLLEKQANIRSPYFLCVTTNHSWWYIAHSHTYEYTHTYGKDGTDCNIVRNWTIIELQIIFFFFFLLNWFVLKRALTDHNHQLFFTTM